MRSFICSLACVLLLSGCTSPSKKEKDVTPQLTKTSYESLPGWSQTSFNESFQAFLKSCNRLLTLPADRSFRPAGTYGDWHAPCEAAKSMTSGDETLLRQFFENWFIPYQVRESGTSKDTGLFTGYYEASLNGSLKRYGPYQTPLYGLPRDLYSADLGQWYEELAGKKITAQVKNGKLQRYPDRVTIETNGISDAEVVAWVDDPVDAFFLQIQGSGVVTLDNGRQMRVGYAGKNGHAYYAIGRSLIERGELTKEEVSLQTIRGWMARHPDQASDLMNLNRSYVFFRRLDTDGPVGAQGVVLTPNRSLAVDRHYYDYGMPVWLSVESPIKSEGTINQLMVAQDTGGAIRGVIRGDFFWGYGSDAENRAGKMKSQGAFWFLLPKTISLK